MRKRIVSVLLTICMIVSAIPTFSTRVYAAEESWLWPAETCDQVQSNFGMRDLDRDGTFEAFHSGIDINRTDGRQFGEPVRAAKSGTVIRVYNLFGDNEKHKCKYYECYQNPGTCRGMLSYGNAVTIDHGDGTCSVYAHMRNNIPVTEGTSVTQGETIGYIGDSGTSGASHLHFQVFLTGGAYSDRAYVRNTMPTKETIDALGLRVVNTYVPASGYNSERMNYINSLDVASRYLSECGFYSCYATVEVIKTADIRSLPCNEETAKENGLSPDEHYVIKTAKVGERYTAVKIVRNTVGNYWYEVKWKENGVEKTGYLFSRRTKTVKTLWDDLEIKNASKPSRFLVQNGTSYFDGNPYFGITGTVKTKYTEPDYIWAYIKDEAGNIIHGTEDSCYSGYNLQGKINNELIFGDLPAGNYTYELKVRLKSFTADNNKLFENEPKTYTVRPLTCRFTGVDPQPVKYAVYFDGGSLNPECGYAKNVYGGTEVGSLPVAELDGYDFLGWYTAPVDGYRVDSNFVVTGNTTLYAQFKPVPCNVVFMSTGGFVGNKPVLYGSQIGTLPVRSKDGFVFEGWYTAPEGGQMVTSSTCLMYGDLPIDQYDNLYLYERWSIATNSGICGDNLTWAIDEDGVLTISGTGNMYDYAQAADVPWNVNRASITAIVLPSGMTSICDYAFRDMKNVRTVSIPYTVVDIGDYAFAGCVNMNSAYIHSKRLDSSLDTAFNMCGNNFSLYHPEDRNWHSEYYESGIAKCSHEYKMDFVAPTCVDSGYDRYICAMCGDKYHENYVDPTGEHFYEYHSEANRITEVCTSGCDHEEFATIATDKDWYFFVGNEIAPAEVQYTDNWVGEHLTIVYENNAAAGIATASVSIAEATAFTNFTLVEPQTVMESYCGNNLVWSVREDGILFIECDGDMPNWSVDNGSPWAEWEENNDSKIHIREVVLSGDVTSIGAYAFSNMGWIESISLPDSIKTIGDHAFDGCYDLLEVDLPEGLTHIGGYAFSGCKSLTEIVLPDGLVSIGGRAFDQCDQITSVSLGPNVINISTDFWSGHTFSGSSLEEILVDAENPYYTSVDGVLYNADQTALIRYPAAKSGDKFEVPFSVRNIGAFAFEKNRNLTEVQIPHTVTTVGYSAFDGCTLEHIWFYGDDPDLWSAFPWDAEDMVIHYPQGNETWPNEELDDYQQIPFVCTHKCVADRTVDATCIAPGYYGSACQYCGVMLDIFDETPASGIHTLMYSAKQSTITERCLNCDHTATAYLSMEQEYHIYTGKPIMPASVEYSENWEGGELVVVYTQNTNVGQATAEVEIATAKVQKKFYIQAEESFEHGVCGDNLTWILTPDNVLTIRGTGPMYDMDPDNLPWWSGESEYFPENVIIEDGVTTIGANAFYGYGIESISIPESVFSIGEYAFYSCPWLEKLDLPEKLTEVGDYAFASCTSLSDVNLPKDLCIIPEGLFQYCDSLTEIVLPEHVYEIGDAAFEGTGLKAVELPANLSKIGMFSFANTDMDCVILPLDAEIGAYAFYNSVTKAYVCTDVPAGFSEEVFVLSDDEYNKSVTVYCADPSGDWFDRNWEQITVELWKNESHVNAQRTVAPTCGNGYTFHYCDRCGNGYRTDFVDGVESHDLSYYSLNEILVETCDNSCGHVATAKPILDQSYFAFTGEEITPVSILYSDEWKGGDAQIFYRNNRNPGVATVDIEYQTAVARHKFTITETPIVASGSCGDNLTWCLEEDGLFAISGEGPMYDYVLFPEGESSPFIPEWQESELTASICELVIGEGVTSIGNWAFWKCENLEYISFPDSLEMIGEAAFADNNALKSVLLPQSLTEVQREAFAGCDSLTALSINENLTTVGEYAFPSESLTLISYAAPREVWEKISEENDALWFDLDDIYYQSFCGIQAGNMLWTYDRQTKTLSIDCVEYETLNENMFYPNDWTGFKAEAEVLSIGRFLYDVGTGFENMIGKNWFSGFDHLSNIVVAEDNDWFIACDGILYRTAAKSSRLPHKMVLCPAQKTSAVIPASVTDIEAFAFEDCANLERVLFNGDAPDTFVGVGYPLFPKSPNVELMCYSDTVGWSEYACTYISRLSIPEIKKTTESISFQIDTTDWPRYNEPRIVVCAVYDEAGRLLGLDWVETSYSAQQISIVCDMDAALKGRLFLLSDSNSLIPLAIPVQFEVN